MPQPLHNAGSGSSKVACYNSFELSSIASVPMRSMADRGRGNLAALLVAAELVLLTSCWAGYVQLVKLVVRAQWPDCLPRPLFCAIALRQ